MNDSGSSCTKCETPLPHGAAFCPACGTATPTGVDPQTGTAAEPQSTDTNEAEFRERLQRALGEAYELRELIGRGGFGVVYAAWDVNLKREVAVKALRFDLFPTESLVSRFRREAESVAKLRHPNVVPIYTIGEAEGFAYFIMPRIEGSSLADVFDDGLRLTMRDAHRVFRELAGALAAAHRAGIIHRDIKPENILLEDPERRALLMDFGIAKTDDLDDAKLTGTGMIVGTPHYMSPEQASGERHLDHRSDIYSLGVVAYQLFAGRTPFKETTSQKVIVERLTTTPEDLAVVNPAVPEDIAAAVMRCLERDPDDRWNSTVNLISVLDTVELPADIDEELALAAGSATIEPLTRRGWIGLGAAAIVLMAAWVATYGQHAAPAFDTPAVTQAEAARIAGDYLIAHDPPGVFQSSIGFHEGSSNTREFLRTALGFAEAGRRAQEDLPVSNWHLVWRFPDEGRWQARVGSDGAIAEFSRPVGTGETGGQFSEGEARAVADSFLVNEGWDPAALDPEGVNSQRESQRIDYFFTWRDTASAIPWTSADDVVDSAVVVLAVDVQGGRVTRYSREFRRPENFDAVSLPPVWAGANGIFISVAIVLAFAMALAPKRRRLVRWRPALIATTIVLVLSAVAGLDALVGGFHDSSTATFGSYVVAQVGAMLGVGLFLGIFFVMLAMAATTLARDVYPAAVAAYEHLMTGRWQPRAVGPIVGVGYVIGFALIGVVGLTEVALGPLSTSSDFGELGWLAYTDESIPFLAMPASSAIGGIAASLAILLALSLGRHLFKSTLMAVAVPTVLIPLLSTPLILNGKPDVLIIGTMALAGMLTVWRFGVVAGVVAFTVLDGADNFHLMASGDGFYVTSGILAWVLLLLPGAVAAIAYLRAGPAPSPVAVVRN